MSLIIGICILPIIALQLTVSWSQWAERKAQIGDLAIHQAELLAGDAGSIAEGARLLLGAAAEFHQVRTRGAECNLRLAAIRRNAPGFLFIALVDGSGGIYCTSDGSVHAADAKAAWIQAAREVTGFVAGRFARSDEYPGGFLPFYFPVANNGGLGDHPTLVAALDLSWVGQHLRQLTQRSSAFLRVAELTVADADGVILARSVQHDEFVGQKFPSAAMPVVQAAQPGILRLKSIDATERVVGFVPPGPATHNL
ncbi:MAG: cache domain-containing protein, partial [Acetobacteraceae bacterium]|nr:cache domain-containing protein [Acetobacteraceae bacterium]